MASFSSLSYYPKTFFQFQRKPNLKVKPKDSNTKERKRKYLWNKKFYHKKQKNQLIKGKKHFAYKKYKKIQTVTLIRLIKVWEIIRVPPITLRIFVLSNLLRPKDVTWITLIFPIQTLLFLKTISPKNPILLLTNFLLKKKNTFLMI